MSAISIVMPLFNKSAYVVEAVSALLAQLSIGDEIIVVDDVSTDDGPLQVLKIASSDFKSRVRLLRHDLNRGPAAARNSGAAVANAPYLLFFDADDIPHPQLLSILHQCVLRLPEAPVFAYDIALQAYGESAPDGATATCDSPLEMLPLDSFVQSCLIGKPLCTASSTCIRAREFHAVGGFSADLRYCEDSEFWARLSSRYPIVHIKRTLALYRDVSTSLSYTQRVQPGSVQPFVSTLLSLSQSSNDKYQRLAQSFVVRNIVFCLMQGASRHMVSQYVRTTTKFLPRNVVLRLHLLTLAPRILLRIAYRMRLARLRGRAAWNR